MSFYKTKRPFILASGSPRRKELLTTLGLPFEILVSDLDESFPLDMSPEAVPSFLSAKKAKAIFSIRPEALILASDTVVVSQHSILNKPLDLHEARVMLELLSGKTHFVYTSFTLIDKNSEKTITDRVDVAFKKLTGKEIDYYLKNGKPADKAGAYGIQEWIGLVAVERIDGSYYTVMGLPTHLLWKALVDGGHIED